MASARQSLTAKSHCQEKRPVVLGATFSQAAKGGQCLTARIAAAVMQQQQSSRAHGSKPSAVQGTIYRSPRAIGDVVGLRRSGSARGRDEIGQAVRLKRVTGEVPETLLWVFLWTSAPGQV